jgi:O-antigen/teichoic acid export membrane protein
LTLLASILVARILGKEDYGQLGIIRSTVGMFGVFAGLGLGLTATKHVAEFRQSDPHRAGRIMALSAVVAAGTGLVAALVLLLFAPWLAEHTLAAPSLAGPLRVGALMLLLSAMNGAQTGALAGFEAFKMIAQVNLAVGLLSFPMLLVGASYGGLTGTVWALVLNLAFAWALNHLALRRKAAQAQVPFRLTGCLREWRVLGAFGLPAALSSLLVVPTTWSCGAMLVNQPGGYGEMGAFMAAQQWFTAVLFVPSVVASSILPILSQQRGSGQEVDSIKLLGFSMAANFLAVAPLVLVGSLLSPYLMTLFGARFSSAWPTLTIVLITACLLAIQRPVGQLIAACGRMWLGFVMNSVWAVVFVVAAYLLIHRGAAGLATAQLVAYLAHAVWTFAFAYRQFKNLSKGTVACQELRWETSTISEPAIGR